MTRSRGSVLVVDHYDSFTWNVVSALTLSGLTCAVTRHDALDLEALNRTPPDGLVLSPGPCSPSEATESVTLVRALAGRAPVLGVCLGHQILASAFGGSVRPAKAIMHGRTSEIFHDGSGLFAGLPSPLVATRYHSLAVEAPEGFRVVATTADGDIMGMADESRDLHGVQFHPESILSERCEGLFENFAKRVEASVSRARLC